MLKRLQIKFVAINMGIVTVMLCVILGMVLHFTQSKLEQGNVDMMRAMAMEDFKQRRPDSQGMGPTLPFFVLHSDTREEVSVEAGAGFDLSDPELVDQLYDESSKSTREFDVIPEYNLRFLRVKLPHSEAIVFSDISSEISTMENLRKSCFIIGALSFFVFLGISILLARWAVAPVAKAWEHQKRFISDASHELKTPLTVITANAEFLQEDCDGESRREFSDNILTMSRQMKSLVESMLELARVDDGAEKLKRSELELSSIIQTAALNFEALFYERDLELVCELEQDIKIKGFAGQIKQLADILLDNAGKYSSAPGQICLSLRKQGKHALLELSNPAEFMDKAALRDIFKRFYRLDEARNRDGSFGLGLSIAKSIVTGHRGDIRAEYADGKISFVVRLPLA